MINRRVPVLMLCLAFTMLIPAVPSALATDAQEAHSAATSYMLRAAQGGPSGATEQIPIIFSAQNGTSLVVGIDASVLARNTTYAETDIQRVLNTNSSITVMYMVINNQQAGGAVGGAVQPVTPPAAPVNSTQPPPAEQGAVGTVPPPAAPQAPDSTPDPAQVCYPVQPEHEDMCDDHIEAEIDAGNLPVDYEWELEQLAAFCYPTVSDGWEAQCAAFAEEIAPPGAVGSVLSTADPCTGNSVNNTVCYYYGKYKKECLPTHTHSSCTIYARIINNGGYALPTSAPADTTPPTITAPADITRTVTGDRVTVIYINLGSATASDNSGIAPTVAHSPQSPFRVGTTTVTWTATDAAGNTATDTQRVTVIHNRPTAPTNPAPAPPPPPTSINPAPATIPSSGTNLFSDTFEGSLSKWVLSGDGNWRAHTFDESHRNAPLYTAADRVAESDNCDSTCIMTTRSSIDLRGKSWAYLEFGRFIDRSLDNNEGLRVELYRAGIWNTVYHWTDNGGHDDDRWHKEAYSLSSHLGRTDLKIRFTATSSSPSEEAAVNDVRVVASGSAAPPADTTPPRITAPADIIRTVTSKTPAAVTLGTPTASDNSGTAPKVTNNAPPAFPVGRTTTVTWTATDAAGNTATDTQRVKLTYRAPVPAGVNPTPVTVPSTGAPLFSDTFDGTLSSKWTLTGDGDWRAHTFDESNRNPPLYTTTDRVAEADNCDDTCVMTTRQTIDLRGHTWAYLEFGRFVDRSMDGDEGLKIELYKAGSWKTIYHWTQDNGNADDRWHEEAYSLSDHLGRTDLKIRFTATSSSPSEEAAVNDVRITVPDTVSPSITAPADLTVRSSSPNGTSSVSLGTPTASDNSGTTPAVTDDAPPVFPVGTTTVTWTATDAAGNTATDTQRVTVTYTAPTQQPQQCTAGGSSGDEGGASGQGRPNPSIVCARDVIYGGDLLLQYLTNGTDMRKDGTGTVTIGAIKGSKAGIVMAGHVLEISQTSQIDGFNAVHNYTVSNYTYDTKPSRAPIHLKPALIPTDPQVHVSSSQGVIKKEKGGSVDAGFIPLQSSSTTAVAKVRMQNSSTFTVVDGRLADVPQNARINIYGIHNEASGTLAFKNVTMLDHKSGDRVHTNMGVAQYKSQMGDSGAPVIYHHNNKNRLIGLHTAAICSFTSPSEGLNYIYNYSTAPAGQPLNQAFSYACESKHSFSSNNNTRTWKVFTAWENTKEALNVRLP